MRTTLLTTPLNDDIPTKTVRMSYQQFAGKRQLFDIAALSAD
jgi:hypothetical protein